MENPLWTLIRERGESIFSVCSANEIVLRAALRQGLRHDLPLLVEATANQVNQFGGYTGMTPADFARSVRTLAREEGFPADRLILGGDHLGPLVWQAEAAGAAMEKAETLIGAFVLAGYSKIHIDTSMRLGDDDKNLPLNVRTVAERSARLARAAERAFEALRAQDPGAVHPVYVIGSEVPTPGGAESDEEAVSVTKAGDFRRMMEIFREVYHREGADAAFDRIIAAVVQPGVEFSDDTVTEYDAQKAEELVVALSGYPGLAFEGHSTDYQTKECLRAMVRDGVRILKVGPALTFSAREGLFALEGIERELCGEGLSDFRATLERVMREDDRYWKKYYHGTPREVAVKLAYSYSDRSRYYMGSRAVQDSVRSMYRNVDGAKPPLSVLRQYMPAQYDRVRRGEIQARAEVLVSDKVRDFLDDYYHACGK
jgi:D-tagatose-1,6-bisphosphate aldolase subunit GatZ/KbaZ